MLIQRTLTLQEEVQVGTELQQHCLNEQFHNVAKLLDHLLSYSSSVYITENSISESGIRTSNPYAIELFRIMR